MSRPGDDLPPEWVRDFEVPSGRGPILCRALDNGCYWELHWLLPDSLEWHESTVDDVWPPGVLAAYEAAIGQEKA